MYPSNTNILFADLNQIEKAIAKCPIPGMLINMKSLVPFLDATGKLTEQKGGRLESTMQNIADHLTDGFEAPLNEEDSCELKTFLTYNERAKTISVTKKTYKPGESLSETPEGCYLGLIENNLKLLSERCKVQVPSLDDPKSLLKRSPPSFYLPPSLRASLLCH